MKHTIGIHNLYPSQVSYHWKNTTSLVALTKGSLGKGKKATRNQEGHLPGFESSLWSREYEVGELTIQAGRAVEQRVMERR
jgi:hypothetical protein